ncbi:M12 family metallo-peptidase [Weeksellaceae bacterium KMM 9713]|uniref:M12 family metallo-peptidase n=1 Tax=Profundicola chukchiensis TaxID=2961959 RepID=A0A9X4MZZ0_9FLAO|nr:zinc-dependent metalloprotease [Profundicola chukchiensis]MDG4946070.1 M12 family metallo-peptidase [Profundicola chukchiensis]
MTKYYFILLAFIGLASMQSQELLRPVELVHSAVKETDPVKVKLFKKAEKQTSELKGVLTDFMEVAYDMDGKKQIKENQPEFIEVDVPISPSETISLQLVKVDIYDGSRQVQVFPENKMVDVEVGVHYRGIVKGKPETIAALSVFEDELIGLASGIYGSNVVIGKLEGRTNHVIYIDQQIAKHQKFECAVPDDNVAYSDEDLKISTDTESRATSNCVRFYIETNYDIYRNKGSESAVSNFATAVLNQVMTLYANDNISTKLMPLGIWTQPSPYTASGTLDLMRQFQNYRTNWNGDLAQLLGFSGGGGIANGFNGICNPNRWESMSYSGINAYYNIVPTYSWTVQVIAHEYGHIMGSRHTHACVWNGNGTAIDSCSGFTEGNCYLPGVPSGGGTIMSYCHQTSAGMNLSLGFGVQPGNVLRNRVNNGSCLSSCGGVEPDPDPDPVPSCIDTSVVFKTDNYPGETSFNLKNDRGEIVAYGYNIQWSNYRYTVSQCLPPGCYTLTFYDTYGDGFCCSYGNGYMQFYEGNTIRYNRWANFGRSISTRICIDNTSKSVQDIEYKDEIPPFTTEFAAISPFSESLVIKFEETKEVVNVKNMKVYDLKGNEVYSQDNVSSKDLISINSSTWMPGVYIVNMNNDGQQKSIKVIKK